MIASILFTFLILLGISGILFFLVKVLLPSLKNNQFNASDTLFSREELHNISGKPDFKNIHTGKKAVVLCSPEKEFSEKRINYNGKKDCSLFMSIYSSENDCLASCVGFGNCVNACPRKAISIENGTAVVNSACNGCGLCISSCPKNLIQLVPENMEKCVLCKAGENQMSRCSMYKQEVKLAPKTKKSYEFWKKCYKILYRK